MADNLSTDFLAVQQQRNAPKMDDLLQRAQRLSDIQNGRVEAPKPAPAAAPAAAPSGAPASKEKSPGIISETLKAVGGGLVDGARNTINMIDDAATWLDNNFLDLRVAGGVSAWHLANPMTAAAVPALLNAGKKTSSFGTVGGRNATLSGQIAPHKESLQIPALPDWAQNKSVPGQMGRSVVQFLTPFLGAVKAIRAVKPTIGAVKEGVIAGAAADASAFDPHDKRLSNMIMELSNNEPVIGKALFSYLAADANDGNVEGRFKNALEGIVPGLAVEGLIKGVRVIRARYFAKGQNPAEAVKAAAQESRVEAEKAATEAPPRKAPRTPSEEIPLNEQIALLQAPRKAPRTPAELGSVDTPLTTGAAQPSIRSGADSLDNLDAMPVTTGSRTAGGAVDPLAGAAKTADQMLQQGTTDLRLVDDNSLLAWHSDDGITFTRAGAEPAEGRNLLELVTEAAEKAPVERTPQEVSALNAYLDMQKATGSSPVAKPKHEVKTTTVVEGAEGAAKSADSIEIKVGDTVTYKGGAGSGEVIRISKNGKVVIKDDATGATKVVIPDDADPLMAAIEANNTAITEMHSGIRFGRQEMQALRQGLMSPTLLAHMAAASTGGLVGFNAADDDATLAEKLSLAGMGALAGMGVKVGASKVLSRTERAIVEGGAHPIAQQLARKEVAAVAPRAASEKARPVIHKAQVEQIVTAAKSGGVKGLLDAARKADFNFDHIDTPQDVKEMIDAFSNVFEKETTLARHGDHQSFEQMKELADELGAGVNSLKELYGDTNNLASRILAHRALLAASAEKVTGLVRIVNESGGDNSVNLLALRKHVAMHAAVQAQMKGVQTEVARALAQFRITTSAADLAVNEVDQLLASLGGHAANVKFAKQLAEITNPKQLNEAIRHGAMARTKNALTFSIVMGKLWSPITHVANSIGNTLTVVGSLAERQTAVGIGKVLRRTDDVVRQGEVKAQLVGMMAGIKEALYITAAGRKALGDATGSALSGNFKGAIETLADNSDEFGKAWNALGTGEPVGRGLMKASDELDLRNPISAEALGLQDASKTVRFLVDALGTLTGLPGHALAAADELFFAIHSRGELHAQAYRQARAAGLEGDALVNRMAQIVSDPDPVLKADAIRAGTDGTFTSPLTGRQAKLADVLNWDVMGIPGGRMIVPFVKTPMNIMNYVGRRNPLTGWMAEAYQADIKAGGARADIAHARIAVGSSLLMTGAWLAGEMDAGGTTIKLHGGGDLKKTAEALGKFQPYSLQVGDDFYAFNRLDPFGMFLGLAADFRDIAGHFDESDTKASELFTAATLSFARNLTSKSYLSGIVELTKALSDAARGNTRAMERWVNNEAAGLTPFSSAFRTARKVDDPVQREVWSLMDAMKNLIPPFSSDLPPMLNAFGEPVVYKSGLGPDIASPIYTTRKETEKAAAEIARLNVDIQLPARAVGDVLGSKGIDLTPQQYHRYAEVTGKTFKELMTAAVNDPGWKDLPEDSTDRRYVDAKEKTIKMLHAKAQRVGFATLLQEDKAFAAAYEQNAQNAGNALQGKPRLKLPQ